MAPRRDSVRLSRHFPMLSAGRQTAASCWNKLTCTDVEIALLFALTWELLNSESGRQWTFPSVLRPRRVSRRGEVGGFHSRCERQVRPRRGLNRRLFRFPVCAQVVEQRRLEKRCATQKEKVQYVLLEDFKTLPRLLREQKSDYGGICCLN